MEPILSDSLLALLSGGATGLLGTVISRYSDHVAQKQKNGFDLQYMQFSAEAANSESENRIAEIKAEAEAQRPIPTHKAELTSKQVLGEDYSEPESRWTKKHSDWFVLVDVLRGAIRPVLTLILCMMVFVVWVFNEDKSLQEQTVMTILYMATTAVLWWFGTRPTTKEKSNG